MVSADGVAPSRMVSVFASVNLPLHHKVQKFSSDTGSPGWSWKKGCKTVVVWWWFTAGTNTVGHFKYWGFCNQCIVQIVHLTRVIGCTARLKVL